MNTAKSPDTHRPFIASNWYWKGRPDGSETDVIYSASSGKLVPEDDTGYQTFLQRGKPTPWPKEKDGKITSAALDAVLVRHGLPETGLAKLSKDQLKQFAWSKAQAILSTMPSGDITATTLTNRNAKISEVFATIVSNIESGKIAAKAGINAALKDI
jgi:hypothetical protein